LFRNDMRLSMMCATLLAAAAMGAPLRAQVADSGRSAPRIPRSVADTTGPKPEVRPPLSPGRAFATSFLLPGYAQTVLGRPKASALFIGFEALCITMLRQAQFDLRQAINARADTVVDSWWDPATGQATRVAHASPFDPGLVRSRRAHVEDWVAVLIANHLFSGLDAYVAANLWDVPAELSVRATGTGVGVGMSVRVP
jgi:hypothetical protein